MAHKGILVTLLVGLIAIQSTKACRSLCPEIKMTLEMTAEDVTLQNIAKNAPWNCVCLEKHVPNKWIMRGNAYDACDKPVCLAQPLGKVIRPLEGPRCPPILMAIPSETMLQYWTRIHDVQTNAPTDGWCPPGQQKWIVYGSVIGKDRDTCTCVNNFYWVESSSH